MKNWKLWLKEAGYFAVTVLIITLLVSTISYFSNMSSKIITILLLLGVVGTFFIFGYRAGKRASSKGYIAGLKIGIGAVLIMLILSFIFFGFRFKLSKVIYYVVLILSSIVGSMLGINKK